MAKSLSYTMKGFKVEGVQYWVCSSCEKTPPFKKAIQHTYKYHREQFVLKAPDPLRNGKFEFPEVWDKCTDETSTGTKDYKYKGKLLGTNKGWIKRKDCRMDPSVDNVLDQEIVETELRESEIEAKSSGNNKADEDETSRRIDALSTEIEDVQNQILEINNSMRITNDKPVQNQTGCRTKQTARKSPMGGPRRIFARMSIMGGLRRIFPVVPSDSDSSHCDSSDSDSSHSDSFDSDSDSVPTGRDEPSIASVSTTSVLEVPSPKTIQTLSQTLQADQVKSLPGKGPRSDSELNIKNSCKMDCGSKKRKRENDDENEIEEEFATLRETMEESINQLLSMKRNLSERREIVRKEEAQMDQRELESSKRQDALAAAEKEFSRVKAMENDLVKQKTLMEAKLKEHEKALQQVEAEVKARDLKLTKRQEAMQQKEVEMQERDSKLSQLEAALQQKQGEIKSRDSKLAEGEEALQKRTAGLKARELKLQEEEEATQKKEVEVKAWDSKLSERKELVKAAAENDEKENEVLRIQEMHCDEMATSLEIRSAALQVKRAEVKYKDLLLQREENAAKIKSELSNTVEKDA